MFSMPNTICVFKGIDSSRSIFMTTINLIVANSSNKFEEFNCKISIEDVFQHERVNNTCTLSTNFNCDKLYSVFIKFETAPLSNFI